MKNHPLIFCRFFSVFLLVLFFTTSGCNWFSGNGDDNPQNPEIDAKQVIQKMIEVYKNANSYSDQGKLTIIVNTPDGPQSEVYPYSISFARPNKMKINSFDAELVYDGKTLFGKVSDKIDYDNQVIVRQLPDVQNVKELYVSDHLMSHLKNPHTDGFVIIDFLFDEGARQRMLSNIASSKLIDKKDIFGNPCYGIEIANANQINRLWIDVNNYLIRRLEYIAGDKLTIDFHDAALNPKLRDHRFQLKLSPKAKQVAYLVPPVRLPTKLLGKPAPKYSFRTFDGKTVDNQSLKGKYVCLLLWSMSDGNSIDALMKMNHQIYDQFKNNDELQLLAVNTDPIQLKNKPLEEFLKNNNIKMQSVRAVDINKNNPFQLKGKPALIIIDRKAVVQDIEVGYSESFVEHTINSLTRVTKGHDVYPTIIDYHDQLRKKYKLSLTAAKKGIALQYTVIVPEKTEPKSLKLTSIWKSEKLKQPGNIAIFQREKHNDRIFVITRNRNITELDLQGKILATHEVKQGEFDHFRIGTNKDAEPYFVTFKAGSEKVDVFDHHFKKLFTYPEGEQVQVGDVRLTDLDDDGSDEILIGFYGPQGIHALNYKGKNIWRSREIRKILNMAVLKDPKSKANNLQITASQVETFTNPIQALNLQGRKITQPWNVSRISFQYLASSSPNLKKQDPQENTVIAKLAGWGAMAINQKQVQHLLVGMTPAGPVWQYPLSTDKHTIPIEPLLCEEIITGSGERQWLVVTSDAAIVLLSPTGKLIDKFHYGKVISGIAVAEIDGKPALIIASAQEIEALSLQPK